MDLLRKILGRYFILKVSYTGQEVFSMSLCAVWDDEPDRVAGAENGTASACEPSEASSPTEAGSSPVGRRRPAEGGNFAQAARPGREARSPQPTKAVDWEDVEVDGIKDRVKKSLLVVVVGGYGVISKETAASPEIAAKVREEGGHYLWSESDGVITFVRAQQLEKLFAELDSAGVHSLGTLLLASGSAAQAARPMGERDGERLRSTARSTFPQPARPSDRSPRPTDAANNDETIHLAEDFFARNATFKKALTPSEGGSLVATALFHRIKLPVLGVVLLALVANTMLSSGVRARYNVTSARLERLKESSEHDKELSQGRRQAMAEFSKGIGYRYAVLCDRIARAMPPRITLTQLAVQPLDKKIEEGRKPQITERSIVVSGTSPDPQSISAYVSALQKQSFANKVKLTSIEQNRENPSVGFTITIEI